MKLTNLSKVLFGLLVITWVMGGVSMNNVFKERDKTVKQIHDVYIKQIFELELELQYTRIQRDSLDILVRGSNIRIDSAVGRIKDLERELKKIPTKYVNKNDEELARLMEERANGN